MSWNMNLQTLEPCNETSCPSRTKTNSWAGYPQALPVLSPSPAHFLPLLHRHPELWPMHTPEYTGFFHPWLCQNLIIPCAPIERGAWQATVHGVTKNWTRLSNWGCACTCILYPWTWNTLYPTVHQDDSCAREAYSGNLSSAWGIKPSLYSI